MSKYRVKEVVMRNGGSKFIPQFRSLLIWWDCEDYDGDADDSFPITFYSLEEAMSYVNNAIERERYKQEVSYHYPSDNNPGTPPQKP